MPQTAPYMSTLSPQAAAEEPRPPFRRRAPKPRRERPLVAVRVEEGTFALSPAKNFYRLEEAAQIFSVSLRTIERWLDDGRLAAVRPGRRRMATADSIMELLIKGWRDRFEAPRGEEGAFRAPFTSARRG